MAAEAVTLSSGSLQDAREATRSRHLALNRPTQPQHPSQDFLAWMAVAAAGPGQAAGQVGRSLCPHWSEEDSMPFLSGGPARGRPFIALPRTHQPDSPLPA